MGSARHHWRKTNDARRQDNGALRTFHPDGKHRWQLRQTRVARSAGAHLLLLSPRRSNRSAHHSSQSVRFFEKSHQLLQSRSMDCGADCPEVQLLAGGPTEDFTREGDHLHRLTTLNSLPRGCCVISSAIGSSREDIMTDTNKRLAIVTDARGIGVM